MTNPTQPAAQEAHIGVIQTSYTVAVTFTERPSLEQIQKLKAAGYQYDRGRWFKNESDSNLATQLKVDQLLAA